MFARRPCAEHSGMDIRHASEQFSTRVAQALAAGRARGGRVSVALSPGALSPAVIAALPRDPALWANAAVFLADTRLACAASCPAGLRAALCDLPLRAAQLHFDVADQCDALRAARAYEQELRAWFGLGTGDLPRFDLVITRLAPDGRVGGLHAGGEALDEVSRLAVAARAGGRSYLTLTPPVLQAAHSLLVLEAEPAAAQDAPQAASPISAAGTPLSRLRAAGAALELIAEPG